MKKYLYPLVVSLILFFSLFSPFTTISASASSGPGATENFNLPKISKERVDQIKQKIKEAGLKPVKEFDKQEEEKIKKSDPFSSMSSQGEFIPARNTSTQNSPIDFNVNSSLAAIVQAAATDNRVKVTDTTVSPYNSIAQIDFYDASTGNGYSCSGTFIDSTTVLTAAHCVYDAYHNRYYSGWQVYPGENGTNLPYYSYPATNAFVSTGWMNTSPPNEGSIYYTDVKYDFAILKLAGSSHPYSQSISTSIAVGDSITSIGYPGDKSIISNGYPYYYMYKSAGSISKIDSGAITHTAYVTSGMSGGPIRKSSVISVNSTSSWAPQFTTYHTTLINDWKAR